MSFSVFQLDLVDENEEEQGNQNPTGVGVQFNLQEKEAPSHGAFKRFDL